MNTIYKGISYIFHPLLMPFFGSLIYFLNAPRFIPEEVVIAKIFSLIIITILVPIVIFYFLKNVGVIGADNLKDVKQRRIPMLLQSLIFLLVIKMLLDIYNYPELYFFFLGILFSSLVSIFLILFGIKISLHMIGIASVTMFTIVLSIHFSINLTLLIAVMIVINGLLATYKLHQRIHSSIEVLLGFLTGIIPQLLLIDLWL